MDIHQKIKAWIGEMSDDYLIVVKADGKIAVATSCIDFANEAMGNAQEAITDWAVQEEARTKRHHSQERRDRNAKNQIGGTCENDSD